MLLRRYLCILLLSSAFAKADTKPSFRLPHTCGGALQRMIVQPSLLPVYERQELLPLLRSIRERLKKIASVRTAFDPTEYAQLAEKGGLYPLHGHCGAVVYLIQSLFGGEARLVHYRSEDGFDFWHMYNALPVRSSVESSTPDAELLHVDLTKAQLDGVDEDGDALAPVGSRMRYQGRDYELVSDEAYEWENDAQNPIRKEIVEFRDLFLQASFAAGSPFQNLPWH